MLSRRWRQRKSVQQVALFIPDDLHLVGSAGGSTVRTALIKRVISAQTRIVSCVVVLCCVVLYIHIHARTHARVYTATIASPASHK